MLKLYCFILIYIFVINFFSFCQIEDNIEICMDKKECLIITLYNNGSRVKKCGDKFEGYEDEPITITFEDRIVIYECNKKEEVDCLYYPQTNNNSSLCSRRIVTNKDYSCCYIKENKKKILLI